MKRIILSATVLLLISATAFTTLQKWVFIGDKWAAFGPDRDVLKLSNRNTFRQIKIRVTDGPLRIDDMDIVFENGQRQNVQLKSFFRAGQESRLIDLPGQTRFIDRIIFKYSTVGVAKGRARVAVWGRR